MIPALIIWLCKKYIAPKINSKNLTHKLLAIKSVLLLIAFIGSNSALFAQQSKFNIKRNGSVIGQMSLSQKEEGENLFVKITSRVNTRFVFKIDVETEDVAHFRGGKLITSGVNRLVNGNVKEAKKTSWVNDSYEIQSGSKVSRLKQPICYNMMLLYSKEPVNIPSIYSDNYQCFLPVKKKGPHQYRVDLPDGNYNDYHFENGICKMVIIHHSMYTIEMERV
ncbi:MAG: hypothetical protein EOO88_00160 [Pedobacter sp.]|nr:MAG: hypothetical protein EOO88_00160 [Pedobacter sp.]